MTSGPTGSLAGRSALTAAVFLVPFVSQGVTPWPTSLFALLVAVAFMARLGGAVKGLPRGDWRTGLYTALGGALALCFLHLFLSPELYSSILFLSHLAVSVAFYWLLVTADAPLAEIGPVLAWVGVLLVWMAIEAAAGGGPVPSGPFANPNYLATVLLACLGWIVGRLMGTAREGHQRTVLAASALGCSAGLLAIGSRSAAMGLLVLWGLHLLLNRTRLRWFAVPVVIAVLLVPSLARQRITEGAGMDPHAYSRLRIWEAALSMGLDHPVAGVGPGLYYGYSPRYAFPVEELPVRYGRIARKPHSEYLKSWSEGGTAGVVLMLLFLAATLRLMARSWSEGRAGPVLGTGAMLFQAAFHDLTEVFALMALMAWWMAQLSRPGEEHQERQAAPERLFLFAAVAAAVVCLAAWTSLDLASRQFWQKGRQAEGNDSTLALSSYRRALKINPLLPGAARDMARVRLSMTSDSLGDPSWEAAERTILRARRLSRLDSVPLRLQAALYEKAAGLDRRQAPALLGLALEGLGEASRLEPYNALILTHRSRILWDLGRAEEALYAVKEALDLEPNYLEAHRMRISYFASLTPDLVDDAVKSMEAAFRRAAGYKPHSVYEEIILK